MSNLIGAEIERALGPGERLLWQEKPRPGIRFQPSDVFMIPFSLLWGGFAIAWQVGVIAAGAPLLFRLWGIPFVLAGLYFIFGRFLFDAWSRGRTSYGVTNERIIIVSGVFSRQTKSLQLRTLSEVSLTERSDGSGTISFGSQMPFAMQLPAGWPGMPAPTAFAGIENARSVHDTIRQAQRAAG